MAKTVAKKKGKTIKKLKRITNLQMELLEKYIAMSRDCNEFGKKALIWMLRRTKNLTVPVSLSLTPKHGKLVEEFSRGTRYINSASGSTHIWLLLRLIGSPMIFTEHCGCYFEGEFIYTAKAYTVWISPNLYSDKTEKLQPDIAGIKAIKLPD